VSSKEKITRAASPRVSSGRPTCRRALLSGEFLGIPAVAPAPAVAFSSFSPFSTGTSERSFDLVHLDLVDAEHACLLLSICQLVAQRNQHTASDNHYL
jgi:hypothetical protein